VITKAAEKAPRKAVEQCIEERRGAKQRSLKVNPFYENAYYSTEGGEKLCERKSASKMDMSGTSSKGRSTPFLGRKGEEGRGGGGFHYLKEENTVPPLFTSSGKKRGLLQGNEKVLYIKKNTSSKKRDYKDLGQGRTRLATGGKGLNSVSFTIPSHSQLEGSSWICQEGAQKKETVRIPLKHQRTD